VVRLAVELVTRAALSFRGAAAALALFAASTRDNPSSPSPTPCATTIRSWVLRLGYAGLTCPLPHDRRWVWLIDHTLQTGSQKIFAIVGVPLEAVPFGVRPLRLSDLHLIALVPMEQSNQHVVDAELEKAVARTGVPRQIICDGASDLLQGIERFRLRHAETLGVPDVAHHAANLLKHYWERDPMWQSFARRMAEVAATIRQTRSAHLMAPKLRNKARFMSVGAFVRFGRMLLARLRSPVPDAEVVKHYGWVREYDESLRAWGEQHALVQATLSHVRVEGLFERGLTLLEQEWTSLPSSDHPVTAALRHRLRAYVSRHGRAAGAGERLVGSTEVLESAFGVQKRLSRDQSKSGLTSASVGLGAVLGSLLAEQMSEELGRVPEKAVSSWAKRWFSKTVQWLRRKLGGQQPASQEPVPDPG
jgi:hypothetical protein